MSSGRLNFGCDIENHGKALPIIEETARHGVNAASVLTKSGRRDLNLLRRWCAFDPTE